MKNTIITIVILLILGFGGYYVYNNFLRGEAPEEDVTLTTEEPEETAPVEEEEVATTTEETSETTLLEGEGTIGQSAGGFDLIAHHFGTGDTELVFIGGTHGGYSWNTVLVAYELIDYFEENPDAIPENMRVTVIPALNPDGLDTVVGSTGRFAKADVPGSLQERIPGRFNNNTVDLNRNFDCDWQAQGVWQNKSVSGGDAAFSEPESKAIRDYVNEHKPAGIVVWYSAVGGVFSSNCHNGVSDETRTLTNLYADASGYRAYEEFNFYEITGDMVNWFAKEGYPAISVLLTTHEDIEWSKNKAGIEALLTHYSE